MESEKKIVLAMPSLGHILLIHSCGGLKENEPTGRGTSRRCGFVVIHVALLGEVCYCGGGLRGLITSSLVGGTQTSAACRSSC